ncbi:MAG TPA: hypothetical protein VN685_04525 [Rhizomicrobium sp.]|jgi:hypothetical protein|nr:hypothetical protein [Rhizomicrobium sp.]
MIAFRFSVFLIALLALSGCNTDKVSNCPVAVILADASQLTVFRPGAPQDLAGEAYRVALVDISTDCSINKKTGETNSSYRVNFRATRAPSAEAAHYTVPYFVAVTQGDRLLEKRILQVSFDFRPGDSVATFSESPDDFDIHAENGHLPIEYELMAGFQMTPAEIEYNKKMGRYTP